MKSDPYSYPDDGRGASDSPGLVTELLSYLPNCVPWECFVPQLNGGFDRFVSWFCLATPSNPISSALQTLFGRRGERNRNEEL